MKQTAVEQFIEQLEKQGESWENMSIGRIQISIKVEDYINLINQAKEMEKEQQGYSEEEVLRIITSCKEYLSFGDEFNEKQWFENFKKK